MRVNNVKEVRQVELRVLNYFLAVVREKSITGAAKALHVSQPTLSRQLMELEEEIGQTLMVRGNRHITLTDEGTLFFKRAEEIMSLVEKTRAEMSTANENMSGDVYIGAAETRGIKAVADAAKALQDDGCSIRYHIFSGNAADVTDRLDKGLIDFAIIVGAVPLQKYDSLRLPFKDRWGLIVRKDDALAARDGVGTDELRQIPLITSKQALDNEEFLSLFGIPSGELNVSATYNLVYNASVMVEEGLGAALALDGIINTGGESALRFVPLCPEVTTHLDFVWKRQRVFSKAAQSFLNKMTDLFS